MLEAVVVLLMIVFAAIAVHSKLLRLSVIALAIFSLLSSALFLAYSAPELAIAETVMGSGLLTLLYLTALKRYHVHTMCVVADSSQELTDTFMRKVKASAAFNEVKLFCRRRERELQLVFTNNVSVNHALQSPRYDLVVRADPESLTVYATTDDYMVVEMEVMFRMRRFDEDSGVFFQYYDPEELS